MFRRCCVPDCTSSRKDTKLHKFPGVRKRQVLWLEYIKCTKLSALSSINLEKLFVCIKHFEKRFITEKGALTGRAYPSLITAQEITTKIPRIVHCDDQKESFIADHVYSREEHDDHTYSEPLHLKTSRLQLIEDSTESVPCIDVAVEEANYLEPFEYCDVPINTDDTSTENVDDNPFLTLTAPEPTTQPEGLSCTSAQNLIIVLPLDPELLAAFGESTSDTPEFGDEIHGKLTELLLPLLKIGLPKKLKEEFLKKHPIPKNCRLLQAPKLNPEISAAVSDMVRSRDKKLQTQQQQLGAGITAFNKAMTTLLTSDDKTEAMKCLIDGSQILADLHYEFTSYRAKLIKPCLNKKLLRVLQDTERDETLFGNSLADKIKASKL